MEDGFATVNVSCGALPKVSFRRSKSDSKVAVGECSNKVRLEEENSDSLPQSAGSASTKDTLAVECCEGPVLQTSTTVRAAGGEELNPEDDSTSKTVGAQVVG